MRDDHDLPSDLTMIDRSAIGTLCTGVQAGNRSYHDACHDAQYTSQTHDIHPCMHVAEAPGCTIDTHDGTITGNVVVEHESVTALHLNDLTAIDGEFVISHSPVLSHIDFGALANVTRVKLEQLPGVSAVEWLGVTRVCEDLKMEQMETLSSISFPNLVSVGDDLELDDMESLSSLDLPALVSVGDDLEVAHMPSLRSIRFPHLAEVGDHLTVSDARVLSSFLAPDLESVGFGPAFFTCRELAWAVLWVRSRYFQGVLATIS